MFGLCQTHFAVSYNYYFEATVTDPCSNIEIIEEARVVRSVVFQHNLFHLPANGHQVKRITGPLRVTSQIPFPHFKYSAAKHIKKGLK